MKSSVIYKYLNAFSVPYIFTFKTSTNIKLLDSTSNRIMVSVNNNHAIATIYKENSLIEYK